jgi:hypothetical protein
MMASRRFIVSSRPAAPPACKIIGGVRPTERQIASIVPRGVAFAMCLHLFFRPTMTGALVRTIVALVFRSAYRGSEVRYTPGVWPPAVNQTPSTLSHVLSHRRSR